MPQQPIRLYVEQPLGKGEKVILGPDQSHYIGNVMRRQVGAPILMFNGRDGEWSGVIEELAKKQSAVTVQKKTRDQLASPDLTLLFAPVKRAPLDQIAQKATEFGVSALQPVQTARTIVTRVKEDRLRANAIEAAEQSERLDVPEILPLIRLERLIGDWEKKNPGRRIMFCDEAGDDDDDIRWGGERGRAQPAMKVLESFRNEKKIWAILTGPEGGFTVQERTFLRDQDFIAPVTLGPRILRADTAVFAAITLWQAALGDFTNS